MALKSVSPTLKIIQSGHFQGTQTLLREEIDKGWGGQSAPQMTSFPASKKLRLVDFGKKWRLPFKLWPNKPVESVHLASSRQSFCVDFVFRHGFFFPVIRILALSGPTFLSIAQATNLDHDLEYTNKDFCLTDLS